MGLRIKDIQGRIDKFLKYSDSLQNNTDYRLKVLFYTLGEVIQHDVYDLFYGSKSPIKSSFKIFCADAIIQILIYLRLKGADLEEIIGLGLDKVTRDKEYTQKLFRKGE